MTIPLTLLLLAVAPIAATPQPVPTSQPADHDLNLHRTYREAFQPPSESNAPADDSSQDLRKLVEQINAMSLPADRSDVPPPPLPADPQQKEESTLDQAIVDSATIITPKAPDTSGPKEPVISHQALETLMKKTPQDVVDPLGLADALFRGGYRREAYIFYQAVYKQGRQDDERAWALYQMAICRRKADPKRSQAHLRQLLADFPESPLAELANAQDNVLDWSLRNQPQTLLEQVQQTLQQSGPGGVESPSAEPLAETPQRGKIPPASRPLASPPPAAEMKADHE
jgi:hypothetical protein